MKTFQLKNIDRPRWVQPSLLKRAHFFMPNTGSSICGKTSFNYKYGEEIFLGSQNFCSYCVLKMTNEFNKKGK